MSFYSRLLAKRLPRRTMLRALSAIAGGVALPRSGVRSNTNAVETLPLVEERISSNGILDTSLTVAFSQNSIDGWILNTRTFDGLIPGPTLRLNPGDRLRILFSNNLPPNLPALPSPNTLHNYNSFNFHTHGLHVDPSGNADNVFIEVLPGDVHETIIDIPKNHPGGLFWYHPHRHGAVLAQVKSGMSGALIVEGEIDKVPEVSAAITRTLIIQHLRVNSVTGAIGEVSPGDGDLGERLWEDDLVLWLLNGQILPTIIIRPGEIQRFRILYAGLNEIHSIHLDGHQLYQLAFDGITLYAPIVSSAIAMAPGNRVDVLVRGGNPGTYGLRFGNVTLATVVVQGGPINMEFPPALPQEPRHASVLDSEIVSTRTLIFDRSNEPVFRFTIDGTLYDERRVDYSIPLGTVEEWTIQNRSNDDHPFHIHTNPFEVIQVGNQPLLHKIWMDVVNVPANSSVKIRIRFEDFDGKFVLHCHNLFHGDLGMMKNVHVYDPASILPIIDFLLVD